MSEKKYINASDFAEIRGFSYPTVTRWLRQGLIAGAKRIEVGNVTVYLIPEEAVAAFEPPKIGRPKKLSLDEEN